METIMIPGPGGPLELLYHGPAPVDDATTTTTTSPSSPDATPKPPHRYPPRPPVLFIHGALCCAHDFAPYVLPFLATHGFHAYALSIRGHGKSYTQSFVRKLLLTTGADWARDIASAVDVVRRRHLDAPPPVLGGHSLGGGFAQYFAQRRGKFSRKGDGQAKMASGGKLEGEGIPQHAATTDGTLANGTTTTNGTSVTSSATSPSASQSEISALVLLAAAPLSGEGKTINSNWHAAEQAAGLTREKNLFDRGPPAMLDTTDKVRAVFFSKETEDAVVERWLEECKTEMEGGIAGLRCFRRMGDYRKVLGGLRGLGEYGDGAGTSDTDGGLAGAVTRKEQRKILFVAAGGDVLVTPEMVEVEYKKYTEAARRIGAKLGSSTERAEDAVDETCMHFIVQGSGHHLMMDAHWEECAKGVVRWLEGHSLES